jgi:hypothetical protein
MTREGSHRRQHRLEASGCLSRYCWRSRRPDQTAARITVHLRRQIEAGVLEGLQALLV